MSNFLIGRNCQLKIVYDDVPYTLRMESFSEADDAELRKRQVIGRDTPITDYIEDGYSGDASVYDTGKALSLITADIRATARANLPAKALSITLTKVYRDGSTTPETVTFTGVVLTTGTNIAGRKEDVKRPLKFMAEDRIFTA